MNNNTYREDVNSLKFWGVVIVCIFIIVNIVIGIVGIEKLENIAIDIQDCDLFASAEIINTSKVNGEITEQYTEIVKSYNCDGVTVHMRYEE